jgi:hypothetical protein
MSQADERSLAATSRHSTPRPAAYKQQPVSKHTSVNLQPYILHGLWPLALPPLPSTTYLPFHAHAASTLHRHLWRGRGSKEGCQVSHSYKHQLKLSLVSIPPTWPPELPLNLTLCLPSALSQEERSIDGNVVRIIQWETLQELRKVLMKKSVRNGSSKSNRYIQHRRLLGYTPYTLVNNYRLKKRVCCLLTQGSLRAEQEVRHINCLKYSFI